MRKYLLFLIILSSLNTFAQEELNNFKFVVVPSKFDFQKSENEYGINNLLKFKFQQLGFETYLDNEEIPKGLLKNTCLYFTPKLITKSNMFKTVARLDILDCSNNLLFTTKEGSSKSKNFKASYNEAIRNALKSFNNYKLEYSPKEDNIETNVFIENNQYRDVKSDLSSNNKSLVNSSIKYKYENNDYFFVVKDSVLTEIQDVTSGEIVGKMIASVLKKGIFHISIYDINGLCYYGENNTIIVEYLSNDKIVKMLSLPRVD